MHQDVEQESVKTFKDFFSNLKKKAFDKGFRISDNPGQGNCMFYALSEQLKLVKRSQSSAAELRQELVQYLQQNPTQVNKLCSGYFGWNSQHKLILFFCLLYLCALCVSKWFYFVYPCGRVWCLSMQTKVNLLLVMFSCLAFPSQSNLICFHCMHFFLHHELFRS